VGENSDLRYCWDDLSKQLEAPSPDFQARIDADTRQVPARMRQARYQSIVNRIATDRDYRDSRSRLPQGRYHPRGKRKDNIEIAAYDRLAAQRSSQVAKSHAAHIFGEKVKGAWRTLSAPDERTGAFRSFRR
jgi:hypothetical protein